MFRFWYLQGCRENANIVQFANQLKCVTTYAGKNMCGTIRGLAGQFSKTFEAVQCSKPLVIHSIIHSQVLRGKHDR